MSKTIVEAYLNFDGRCEEALEFYREALDAKVDCIMRFSDAPPGEADSSEGCPGGDAGNIDPNKVMHSLFHVGETGIMASDCRCEGKPGFQGFSLAISLDSEDDARRYFGALSEGGKVEMPLGKTFWSPCFGVVADRFGVSWMLVVQPPSEK